MKKCKMLEPIKLGRITLKNRITVAPHGSALHSSDGGVGPKFYEYMKNLARGGAALVVIGSGNINRETRPFAVAHPASYRFAADYVELTEMMHQFDCKISMQLVPSRQMLTPGHIVANESTHDDIRELCSQYADAAKNCMDAGFDMVLIHGGHGNVPSMFFSRRHNHRTDEYGGSLENRARFAVELLTAIREKCGDGIGIEYRLSAEEIIEGGTTIEETLEFAKLIQDKVDLIHVSRGLLEEDDLLPYMFSPPYLPRAMNLDAAKRFKQELDVPVCVVGGMNLELADAAIENGDVDVVSIMRGFFADPAMVNKYARERENEIRPCVRCNTCITQTHARLWPVRCAVNPLIGRETLFPPVERKLETKKVVLIGGGPANLEAARTAARRGHEVVLFEQENELGGALRYAAAADFKYDMKKYLDWSIRDVTENADIDIRMNTRADRAMIEAENPDAVIIAVGATPIMPQLTAAGTDKVAWIGDVESGSAVTGERVIVAGAGFTGLEMALTLSNAGKKVTIIDLLPESQIGADGIQVSIVSLRDLLGKNGVEFMCEVRLLDVTSEGAIIEKSDGSAVTIGCDTVVLALGVRPDTAQVAELADIVEQTYVIGDCSSVGGTLWRAVRSGFDMAMEL